jgi:hypothetical protein
MTDIINLASRKFRKEMELDHKISSQISAEVHCALENIVLGHADPESLDIVVDFVVGWAIVEAIRLGRVAQPPWTRERFIERVASELGDEEAKEGAA